MAIYSYLLINTKTRAFHICESIYSGVTVTFYMGSSGMLFVLFREVICFIEGCPCVIVKCCLKFRDIIGIIGKC